MHDSAKILEIGANGAVVQLPERRFPGIVIQGDSLSILVSDFRELKELIAKGEQSETEACLASIEDHLGERLAFYESVIAKHGIELPYVRHKKKG